MTVEDLLKKMSSKEFAEWLIYYKWNLFPEDMENVRHCITCDLIAKSLGNKNSTPSAYMPKVGFPRIQTVEEMKSVLIGKK
jgi:hypothetical protein